MEQRRSAGKNHWYHETQCRTLPQEILPLVPEAANVADPFLLDLILPTEFCRPFAAWLSPARRLDERLFPPCAALSQMHTFSAYERMSTALTVAQVCGIQRLCSHYAARLTPLPGPDSSRESNRRLAQIAQFARQLAGSPAIVDARARRHLDDVGLTTRDVIVIAQIVGYVGFQARALALFQALLDLPVRRVPGLAAQECAPAPPFQQADASWRPAYDPVEPSDADAEQQLTRRQTSDELRQLAPLLAHEPAQLEALDALIGGFLHGEPAPLFASLLTSRINGSVACFNSLAHRSPELAAAAAVLRQDEAHIQRWPADRPSPLAIQLLNCSPDRLSAAHLGAPGVQNAPAARIVNTLAWCGLYGWLNRLKIALGETYQADPFIA
ncbi:CMD domain-containing protein [Intestinirhabdus alba]|jgi:uncharacterized protein YciW|uniref:CMD domain-containing protein n=1 Tax=Intestinirhabdus alba TaxID=2899544 RepID=A0A6L6IKV9_9ENTR|nr:CMD domain-containing protein [Intestinirhabdus alba]MTH46348.1 CMD domain-containing protein [Intestinirhabdus alba]